MRLREYDDSGSGSGSVPAMSVVVVLSIPNSVATLPTTATTVL
ncbi:hypothetical protein [Nocardia asiatica]|nr:hypothetical protein [Nocardia asiatica]